MIPRRYRTFGGDLRYWVSGAPDAQRAWFVFLPGLTADHSLFESQITYFNQRANCLVWDAPAHGLSRPWPLNFSLDDYARLLHDILLAEGVQRPIFVGQSLGGYVAQTYLQQHPGTLAGFVAIDSAPLQRSYISSFELWSLRHTKLMYRAIPWSKLVKLACEGNAETEHGREQMRRMMGKYEKREFCNLASHGYRMLADAYASNRPYYIDCPTLLLCGESDNAGSTRRLNSAWNEQTGLPLIWVPGAGHNSNVDNPDFVNNQIERFATSL